MVPIQSEHSSRSPLLTCFFAPSNNADRRRAGALEIVDRNTVAIWRHNRCLARPCQVAVAVKVAAERVPKAVFVRFTGSRRSRAVALHDLDGLAAKVAAEREVKVRDVSVQRGRVVLYSLALSAFPG